MKPHRQTSESLFRYPGGKFKLRSQILKALLRHIRPARELKSLQYREPFLGGGSILLELTLQTAINKIWINDKNIGIACFWTGVMKYNDEMQGLVSQFAPSVDEFDRLKNELVNIKEMPKTPAEIVEVGFKQLALHRISFSGLATRSGGPLGGRKQKSPMAIDSRWNPDKLSRYLNTVRTRWVGVFSQLEIHEGGCTNLDFEALITDESCPALLYLDPPYFRHGSELYQCGFSTDDHRRLAALLRKTPHSWVLSYDDCTEIRELYRWACIEQIEDVQYSIAGPRKQSELLIHPPYLQATISKAQEEAQRERERLSAPPATLPIFELMNLDINGGKI